LLATLAATSRSLPDADLETAVELVGALDRRRRIAAPTLVIGGA